MMLAALITPRPLAASCYGFIRKETGFKAHLLAAGLPYYCIAGPNSMAISKEAQRTLFQDRADGCVTVRIYLPIDPCTKLVTRAEEPSLSPEFDVGDRK